MLPIATGRVAFNRDGIAHTEVHGVADLATGRMVSDDDPMRIASNLKLILAVSEVRPVEAGQLAWDANVSPLLGYRLRYPHFPAEPVALRQQPGMSRPLRPLVMDTR